MKNKSNKQQLFERMNKVAGMPLNENYPPGAEHDPRAPWLDDEEVEDEYLPDPDEYHDSREDMDENNDLKSDSLASAIRSAISGVDDSLGYKDLALAVAKILKEDYGQHNFKPFMSALLSELKGNVNEGIGDNGDEESEKYEAIYRGILGDEPDRLFNYGLKYLINSGIDYFRRVDVASGNVAEALSNIIINNWDKINKSDY